MKTNKQLQYLIDTGAINGTKEEIAIAISEYRKMYKREWRRNNAKKKADLRPSFTPKELYLVTVKARELGYTPTHFLRLLLLEAIGENSIIPQAEKLYKILQLIGMVTNDIQQSNITYRTKENIQDAEKLLLDYLKQ
jgi:hypothetical protein